MAKYSGKRVTVMGLGLFGGGVGAARHYAENGAEVTVTDRRGETDLKSSIDALAGLPIRYVLGRHETDDFRQADILLVNPGVPEDSPLLVMARGAGAQIERAINLLFKLTPQSLKVGITGSNGKSTTTALLGAMLQLHDPRTLVGGNLGGCLLAETKTLQPGVPIVLELSSFMLEGFKDLRESPHIAIVTNLSPNHLDRHVTMASYAAAKTQILAYQTASDVAILNADDASLCGWEKLTPARIIRFSTRRELEGDGAFLRQDKLVVRLDGQEDVVAMRQMLRLPGIHNVANALAASAAAIAYGVRPGRIAETLATFTGLPHRLEMVARTPTAITFYNDSIATTPESVMCALASFNGPVTLIAGGSDKGTPFNELGVEIARKVRRLILIGVTAPQIEEAVRRAAREVGREPEILRAKSLEQASRIAADGAVNGEAVLLSPACASFDMFRNFQERGDIFRVLARKLAANIA